jgi:hypothetical protein
LDWRSISIAHDRRWWVIVYQRYSYLFEWLAYWSIAGLMREIYTWITKWLRSHIAVRIVYIFYGFNWLWSLINLVVGYRHRSAIGSHILSRNFTRVLLVIQNYIIAFSYRPHIQRRWMSGIITERKSWTLNHFDTTFMNNAIMLLTDGLCYILEWWYGWFDDRFGCGGWYFIQYLMIIIL